jgi:tRNA(fMet)-specific endonuclease VapC
MIRYLLDTNIISDPARPDPSEEVVERLEAHSDEAALPSIVWHELVYGVERMDQGRRRAYLADYLREVVRPSMAIIPYDEAAAQWHGAARAGLEAQGLSQPFADGQIAAIAATRGLILVTRNTSDFERYDELHVENWFAD